MTIMDHIIKLTKGFMKYFLQKNGNDYDFTLTLSLTVVELGHVLNTFIQQIVIYRQELQELMFLLVQQELVKILNKNLLE